MTTSNTNPSTAEDVVADEVAADAAVEEAGEEPLAPGSSLTAADLDALEQSVDRMISERDEYLEALRRLQADFENYKKRVGKQQQEQVERANESLVLKLLPVLDTIELAKAHDPNGPLEHVASALDEVLAKEGLERIDAVSTAFDPTIHDAVAHEEGESPPEVTEVMRAGYTWKGRVLRPAMVRVKGS